MTQYTDSQITEISRRWHKLVEMGDHWEDVCDTYPAGSTRWTNAFRNADACYISAQIEWDKLYNPNVKNPAAQFG